MAGTVSSDRIGWALRADVVASPQGLDKAPKGTGGREVVVAVVAVAGVDVCAGGLGPRGVVAESGMVGFRCAGPQVNAWPLSDAS